VKTLQQNQPSVDKAKWPIFVIVMHFLKANTNILQSYFKLLVVLISLFAFDGHVHSSSAVTFQTQIELVDAGFGELDSADYAFALCSTITAEQLDTPMSFEIPLWCYQILENVKYTSQQESSWSFQKWNTTLLFPRATLSSEGDLV